MRGNSDILRLVLKKKKYRFAIIFYRSFKTNFLKKSMTLISEYALS